jgi:protein-S-isoprenylcysteine O-methyltransferase Ste14
VLRYAFAIAWVSWFASWWAAAWWSDRAAARPPFRRELLYRGVTIVGSLLLFGYRPPSVPDPLLWRSTVGAAWTLLGVAVAGFAFTWWARIHLGRLWSATVTRKAGHRVVDSGPYGIVRHPIYTGLLLAVFGTALVQGTALALAGAGIVAIGFVIKARLEERFLRAELGREAYDAYARRVPMLVPLAGTRRIKSEE